MKYLNMPLPEDILKALDADAKNRQMQKRRIIEDILRKHYKLGKKQ